MRQTQVDWENIFQQGVKDPSEEAHIQELLGSNMELNNLLKKYEEVFRKELGKMKDIKNHLKLKEAQPKIFRARPVAYVLKPGVESELESLVEQGVYQAVTSSDLAAPIVLVRNKKRGWTHQSVRRLQR